MKKFEYYEISELDMNHSVRGGMLDSEMKKILKQLGLEGWEMIAVTNTGTSGNTYFFKREIEN